MDAWPGQWCSIESWQSALLPVEWGVVVQDVPGGSSHSGGASRQFLSAHVQPNEWHVVNLSLKQLTTPQLQVLSRVQVSELYSNTQVHS